MPLQESDRHSGYGQDGDVILLPKGLRCVCYFFGGLGGNGLGAFKAEQLAVLIARFDDAIG